MKFQVFAPLLGLVVLGMLVGMGQVLAQEETGVEEDPLVRMPGTQPAQNVVLESPRSCLGCHANYDQAVEPGFNWKGAMMAQAARDPLFYACLGVAIQDSYWALGTPNAGDLCLRCHFPTGWLAGRSDPPNAAAMTGADFDGVQCDVCHRMYDPFFQDTFAGTREGNDWTGYWDEAGTAATPSQPAAEATLARDAAEAAALQFFNGDPFYGEDNRPVAEGYTENGTGQYFVSKELAKRGPFNDAAMFHEIEYSRYHKSKYMCGTCHDVSNPALNNLGAGPGEPLPTETMPAFSYVHVERTFSEFMLSAYAAPGGAPGKGPFAPEKFTTSLENNYVARCQDCHLRDVSGNGCGLAGPSRPGESQEHPKSGLPMHDQVGGNAWVPYLLASTIEDSEAYDATNAQLLGQGPEVLTLDLTQGVPLDAEALLAAVERAKEQLASAASIEALDYDPASGALSFRIQNQTGHKLITGFLEGRRMFVNVRAYADDVLVYEVNPYDETAGTLRGLDASYTTTELDAPAELGENEVHMDALVYETKPKSTLTGEDKTFHFVLADGRYKDNRIPPKGFQVEGAMARLSEPVWEGASDLDYFTDDEYAGGYDAVSLDLPPGAGRVEVTLYYQTTSREYVEFLRDELEGRNPTLSDPPPSGRDAAYIAQTDPFFDGLRAWGDTIWQLWLHNKEVPGAAPLLMASAQLGGPDPEGEGEAGEGEEGEEGEDDEGETAEGEGEEEEGEDEEEEGEDEEEEGEDEEEEGEDQEGEPDTGGCAPPEDGGRKARLGDLFLLGLLPLGLLAASRGSVK